MVCILPEADLSRNNSRLIPEFFQGICRFHRTHFVLILYHKPSANGYEFLNEIQSFSKEFVLSVLRIRPDKDC